jgi:hypothetical protein
VSTGIYYFSGTGNSLHVAQELQKRLPETTLILLFLVGGGIAQVVFFVPAWAVATRINGPLTWWQRALPDSVRRLLARGWLWLLVAGSALLLLGLVVSVTGFVPGVTDPEQILSIDWTLLGIGWLLFILAYVAGFAHDIGER